MFESIKDAFHTLKLRQATKNKSLRFVFVHEAMPHLFHDQSTMFVDYLTDEGDKFMKFWWEKTAENMKLENVPPSDGLTHEIRQLDERTKIILITLPQPRTAPEAYFAALYYQEPVKSFFIRRPLTRIYTLEMRENEMGGRDTVLAEWTFDKLHHIIGTGPNADKELFYAEVMKLLGKAEKP